MNGDLDRYVAVDEVPLLPDGLVHVEHGGDHGGHVGAGDVTAGHVRAE